ncbi:MAG: hypothetical protein NHF90_00445 [Candidatus Shikimatogenerans sp. JK-2022]|nr:hypothetical protein [Candidatus Shikimatogenerans bostrichidophilus]
MKYKTKNLKKILPYYKEKSIYNLEESLKILKKYKFTKFNPSVNLTINLITNKSINFKKNIFLPYSNDKHYKILVLINKEKRKIIENMGIKLVGGKNYINKIEKEKWIDFDIIIANKYYMKYILKLVNILGQKKLIPNYEDYTIVDDKNYCEIIKKYKEGKRLLIKPDKYGIIHLMVGKISTSKKKLIENINYIIKTLEKIVISNKKINIKSMYINTTMSPSLKFFIN